MNTAKYIYSLSCPVTGYVKYVGCTSNLKSSLLCHSTGRNIPVRSWISSLNDKPVIEVLDLATEENVLEIESYWIQQMQVWGFCLLNKKSTLSRPYKKLYPRPSKVNIFDQIKEYGLYIKLAKELESLKQAKQQFKVGMWCKNHGDRVARITNMDDDKNIETVLPDGDIWKSWLTSLHPATPTEIQEALEKEAVKKGFKPGDQITGLWPYDESMNPVINNSIGGYYYIPESDTFGLNNAALYCQGVWATVIKEQPLMIGEYPVKAAIEGVTINHTFYPESSIFKIKEALEVSNIKSVNVGCNGQYKVDLEMINKIIKLIK